MEPISPIGVQFQITRSYNTVFQVDGLAPNVAFSFQDESGLIGDNKVVLNQLAVEDVATVGEQSEPA